MEVDDVNDEVKASDQDTDTENDSEGHDQFKPELFWHRNAVL